MTTTTPTGNHGGAVMSCSPYAHPGFAEICICIELGPQRSLAHYELAYLIKKKKRMAVPWNVSQKRSLEPQHHKWVANCCVWVELSMSGCKSGQQGTLCIRKYRCDYVLPPLLSTCHMALNAEFLAPGSTIFYLRGTTGCACHCCGPLILLGVCRHQLRARTLGLPRPFLGCFWMAALLGQCPTPEWGGSMCRWGSLCITKHNSDAEFRKLKKRTIVVHLPIHAQRLWSAFRFLGLCFKSLFSNLTSGSRFPDIQSW